MKRGIPIFAILFVLPLLVGQSGDGCNDATPPVSDSGVKKAQVDVPVGSDGRTVEQSNIANRLLTDNKPGSIKHLYVISAYSGQTIIYSTVKGKVTSGGKRLTPTTVQVGDGNAAHRYYGFEVFGNRETSEVLQDDGSYGSSMDYLFWWDTKGVYHQHYVSGGQILHISDQPLAVKHVMIDMNLNQVKEE
jgi:hypothetical protein